MYNRERVLLSQLSWGMRLRVLLHFVRSLEHCLIRDNHVVISPMLYSRSCPVEPDRRAMLWMEQDAPVLRGKYT